nr:hypothetical protein [Escherichia coli]
MDLINPSQRRMRRSERITGKYQQAIQAATAAVQGLAGGNLSAALAGGAAPYIAEIIKQTTPDGAGRVAAHAVVNATLSLAQGKNALAGAAGVATGEVVGMIATQMYGKPVNELSETEKQTVSTKFNPVILMINSKRKILSLRLINQLIIRDYPQQRVHGKSMLESLEGYLIL